MSSHITIVIADDHPIFRDGLRRLLETEPDLKVIGEAGNASDAVRGVIELKPDILLVDLKMPPKTGSDALQKAGLDALRDLDALRARTAEVPKCKPLLLTAEIDVGEIVLALHLGAHGVVLKDAATRVLIESIRTVMAGGHWVGNQSVPNLLAYLTSVMQEVERKKFSLTPRELDIVSGVVAALGNKEIAQYFKISEDTVKHHMSNIFDKLGVSTRLELALFAVNHKLPLKDIT